MKPFEFPPLQSVFWTRPCQIVSMARVLPKNRIDNQQIRERSGCALSERVIEKTVGVQIRYVADEDQSDSDLLALAAQQCLEQAGVQVEQLSKLMVNKFLGDRLLPPTASILQKKLGSSLALQCMDIDGGTHSFLQAFLLAAKCIESGDEYILIASGGLCHSLVSQQDPRIAFLFGDGATAVLLGKSEKNHLLSHYEFSSYDHAYLHRAIAFHQLVNTQAETGQACYDLLTMGNWKEAQDFVVQAASHTLRVLLQEAGISQEEVDWFLVTEINGPQWQQIINALEIPAEKTRSLLASQGHTLSANLPMQWAALEQEGCWKPGQIIAMLSLGEGICGGGCLYQK